MGQRDLDRPFPYISFWISSEPKRDPSLHLPSSLCATPFPFSFYLLAWDKATGQKGIKANTWDTKGLRWPPLFGRSRWFSWWELVKWWPAAWFLVVGGSGCRWVQVLKWPAGWSVAALYVYGGMDSGGEHGSRLVGEVRLWRGCAWGEEFADKGGWLNDFFNGKAFGWGSFAWILWRIPAV